MGKPEKSDDIGKFFYLSDRFRQIELLKNNATPGARPYVQKAYDIIIRSGKISQNDQEEKARWVLGIAQFLADESSSAGPESIKKEFSISLPESSILINETLKPMLPCVNKIRRELWGSEKPPFPSNPAKALKWLETTAAEQNAPIVKKRSDTRAQSKAIMQKIGELIGEYTALTGHQIAIDHSQGACVSIAGKDHAKQEGVITFAGTNLSRLAAEAKQLSVDRAFMPSAIVRFIMTGIRPVFLAYHMTVRKNSLKATQIKLELWRPLKKEEMKALYFEIKAEFGKRDKTFLKEKNRRLYELVEKHGGAPKKDRAAFWMMIKREWNGRNPKAKYTTANGPRIAYKRILGRAH